MPTTQESASVSTPRQYSQQKLETFQYQAESYILTEQSHSSVHHWPILDFVETCDCWIDK